MAEQGRIDQTVQHVQARRAGDPTQYSEGSAVFVEREDGTYRPAQCQWDWSRENELSTYDA